MSLIKSHHEIDAAVKIIADWRSMMVVHAIYENGPVRYTHLESMLDFSPTVLSKKLSQLTRLGIISRHKYPRQKEVRYEALPIAQSMVKAYHLLDDVNLQIVSCKT